MARKSSKLWLRPNLRAEIRAAFGAEPSNLEEALSILLRAEEPPPPGLLRAIAFAMNGEDDDLEIKIQWKRAGRPLGASNTPGPIELFEHYRQLLSQGELKKNAIADTLAHFEISRATFYRLLALAEAEQDRLEEVELARQTIRKPRGHNRFGGKSARRSRAKKHIGKRKKSWLQVRLPKGEARRAFRAKRLSQKLDDK